MVVDISPSRSSSSSNFRFYIQAMQEMKISSDIPRSTARRMAEDQLRTLVEVRSNRHLFNTGGGGQQNPTEGSADSPADLFMIDDSCGGGGRHFGFDKPEDDLLGVFQNRSVRQFLLTNLVEHNGHYAWRVNLEAISAHLEHVMSFPSFDATFEGPTLFLGGASSAYIR